MPKHSIETSEESGVRYLHFGSEWIQGGMRIARPWALELEYTREMMGCLLLRPAVHWPRTVLQVGLGAASITKWWYRHFPDTHQTVVELNPNVVNMAYAQFKLPRDPARIDIHIGDGVAWMEEGTSKFDCIMVDGYDQNARFGALGTEEFYRACRKRLSRQGLLTLNLFGRARGFAQQIQFLRNAFDKRVLALPALEEGNAIAFAADGEEVVVDLAQMRERAPEIQLATGLKLMPTIARIERAVRAGELQ